VLSWAWQVLQCSLLVARYCIVKSGKVSVKEAILLISMLTIRACQLKAEVFVLYLAARHPGTP
jgi:hypothetical protein